MTYQLDHSSLLGAAWNNDYDNMSDEDKAAEYKNLKNKGYYRGAMGGFCYNGENSTQKAGNFGNRKYCLRRVLCTVHIDPKKDHYLRIRCVSTGQTEFDLDYLELVPKSVYGVSDGNTVEDSL